MAPREMPARERLEHLGPFLSLLEVSGREGFQAHQAPVGPSCSLQLANAIWFLFHLFYWSILSPTPNNHLACSVCQSDLDVILLKNGDIFCEVWRFLSPSGASAAQLPSSLAIQGLERSNAFVLLSVHLSKERLAVRLFLWGWESMQNSPVSCRAVRT